ncbi:MAG: hypothetical protein JSS65_14925 [Armatimonadetes bacterium]|nr:hypothetical protein [Armatimonadota bacterium]
MKFNFVIDLSKVTGQDAKTFYSALAKASKEASEAFTAYVRDFYTVNKRLDYEERESDPVWVKLHQEKEDRRHELVGFNMLCFDALAKDIIASGVPIRKFSDLYHDKQARIKSLPVIAKHVRLDYPDQVKGGMAATMNIREADKFVPELIEEFKLCAKKNELLALPGLAEAISSAASSKHLPALAELSLDSTLGDERVRFIHRLKRSRSTLFQSVIDQLERANDPLAKGW